MENGYEPKDMAGFPNTAMVVADFISSLQVISTPLYLIKEALTAVKGLFEIAKEGILQVLQDSQMIAEALRASTTGVKRASKYRTIWKLEVLLEHIRSGQLEWFPLMARTAALFMIFIPCRPVGAWRIDPRLERWASDGSSVELLAKEKTDYGKGVTAFLTRKGPVPNLCPLLAYCTIKTRASAKGLVGTLWGSKTGVAYKQAAALSRFLKNLLKEAGIPPIYTAYSIRHALITELFNRGLREQEANAYTGHSNNAHTALTNYFHLEENWVGRKLVGRASETTVSDEAAQVIEQDNQQLQDELHEGEVEVVLEVGEV
jgi:integrase